MSNVSTLITFNIAVQQTPPIITFSGGPTVTIERGSISEYTHDGTTAVNYMNTNIFSYVVVSGYVNTNQIGNYTFAAKEPKHFRTRHRL